MQSITVRVVTRFRGNEGEDDNNSNWIFPDEQSVYLGPERKPERTFVFDGAESPKCNQEEFYEKHGKDTIVQFMNGYNGTIFAYGQSGSGKTYTMLGPEDVTNCLVKGVDNMPESVQSLYGIIPRTTLTIFQLINEGIRKGIKFTLKCSYLEVYNESLNDLLTQPPRTGLKIREYPNVGMVVVGLEENYLTNPEEIFKCLALGTQNRMVSSTNQNARSSRSHTVFVIVIEQKFLDGSQKVSKLNLVDLAGSEKISKTGATGQTLEEAKKINQSLSCLGLCIMALSSSKKKHIPYRDSKLTLILKESLGGNSKTTLICACSKKGIHEDETINTLKFAQRAKRIKNRVCSNVKRSTEESEALILNLKVEIENLRKILKNNNISIPNLHSLLNSNGKNDEEIDKDKEIYIKYKELETKYQCLEERTQIEVDNLRDQLEILANNPVLPEEEINQRAKEIEDYKQKINDLNIKIECLEEERNSERVKYEKEIDLLLSENSQIKIDLEDTKSNIMEYEKKMLSLSQEIEQKRKEQITTKSGYEHLKELFNKLELQNDEADQKNKILIKEKENLVAQTEEKKKKLEGFMKDIEELKKKINEMDNEMVKLNIVLHEQNEKENSLNEKLINLKDKYTDFLDESRFLKDQKDEVLMYHKIQMEQNETFIKDLLEKQEKQIFIINELENQINIYRKGLQEKGIIDDVEKLLNSHLEEMKSDYIREIQDLEKETEILNLKIVEEKEKRKKEKEENKNAFKENIKNLQELYTKKFEEQEKEYLKLRKETFEIEIKTKILLEEKENSSIKVKELEFENEKRKKEQTKLNEELQNLKLLLVQKEETKNQQKDKHLKKLEELKKAFQSEIIKNEEELNEIKYEKSNQIKKEKELRIEIKKQKELYDLERENYIKKSQQYEDLLQEFKVLKSFQENLNQNALNQSFSDIPIVRNRFTLQSKKESVICKPVFFMENLFGKTLFESKKREDEKKEPSNSIIFDINNRENIICSDRAKEDNKNEGEMNGVLGEEIGKKDEIGLQKGVSHESIKSSTMVFNEEEWNSDEEEGKEEI